MHGWWRENKIEEITMSKPDQPTENRQQLPTDPVTAWLYGFDYAFGYQMKLLQDLLGVSQKRS